MMRLAIFPGCTSERSKPLQLWLVRERFCALLWVCDETLSLEVGSSLDVVCLSQSEAIEMKRSAPEQQNMGPL